MDGHTAGYGIAIWHDWKNMERNRNNLIRLGVDRTMPINGVEAEKDFGQFAQNPFLNTAITVALTREAMNRC